MEKKKIISYLDIASLTVISAICFLLPGIFFTSSTDFFIIPKQILVVGGTLLLLLIWGTKSIVEKKVVLSANPLNLPVFAFGIVLLLSSILSRNKFDSLFATIPMLLAITLFFVITNLIKEKKSLNIVIASLLVGASVASLISTLYYFKVYLLPFTAIRSQYFNTFGSSIQQIAYTLPLLVLVASSVLRKLHFPKFKIDKEAIKKDYFFVLEAFSTIILSTGLITILAQIITLPQKPIVLPYAYGLQTAFASISQDASRFLLSLFFGSGYGTFLSDFTRFRLPTFNLEQNIWNLSFSYSSSYFLELIATTGLVGGITFISILVMSIKNKAGSKNPIFVAVFLLFVLSFLLPFSFTVASLLLIVIALYVSSLFVEKDKRVYDISIVALKIGLFPFETTPENGKKSEENVILPVVLMAIILGLCVFVSYYTFKFVVSDVKFANSLQAANANNAQLTYTLQTQAIQEFPYRSDYHRIFSQINLAIANSLVSNNSNPNQQVQQNIVQLLQQSIGSARNAVTLSPITSANWQNLGGIYRNLINVGQNAEQFAIASINQAIALDPYNPQLYIQLGGIYYQLGQFEAAQTQFQTAVNLKKDFANAYYNLGHALESKGSLEEALSMYQIVKQLVKDNADNLRTIDAEIKTLEEKAGQNAKPAAVVENPTKNQPDLNVNTPETTIPPQKPPIKISPPPTTDSEASSPSAR